ncbi:MAG TPA: trigger factor [Polyangiaceae bacterium]|nr:trigger factor [Polyangiaceae bacterium]
MQVTVSRISQVLLELQVDIPADKVKAEVERVYSSLSKKAHVKGYRPGKAPRPVLKTLYGAQVENDVAQNLVNANLPVALSEQNVTPISQPQVTDASRVSGNAPFTFKARMEVQPELDDVKYEGFQLYRPKVEVTDAEVDAQIEGLRVRHAAFKTPEPARPAASGDVVTIDFTLSVDGKPVTDGGGEGVQLELGAGQALPELDAAIIGKSVGDTLEVDAAFQANHPRKDFQGKTGKFSVKVTDVKERQLPEVDDEFAKDVGNFGTVVELRADIHTRLEKLAKERSETAVAEQIVAKLNELNPCEVPPSLVLQQAQMLQQELAAQARRLGQRFTQAQAEELGRAVLADAERKVRAGLIMAGIARKNQFQVTAEDMEKGYAELAEETGKNVAKLRVEYREKAKQDILVGMILEDKILDFIESKSNIVDGDPPALEAKAEEAKADEPKAEEAKAEEPKADAK